MRKMRLKSGLPTSVVLLASFVLGSLAWAGETIQFEYKKTFDNIPAKWSQFYLGEEKIDQYRGDPLDEVLMTKHTYGQHGDGIKLAGGYWFTVIGENEILIRDEDDQTVLLEMRYCPALKRARYIFLPTEKVIIRYRNNGSFSFTTRFSEGFAHCEIIGMHEWRGPLLYIDDIKHNVRNYHRRETRKKTQADLLHSRY